MNAISFSLFGYKGNVSSAYPFGGYFRGVSFNMKMAELIYPGWKMHLVLDEPTYDHFKEYFDYHVEGGRLNIDVLVPDDLCMMMLQRMRPVFQNYDRVICRDLDSLVSYKERQAVEYWISTGRVAHCITDSVSHTIALMGGMVGFSCKELRDLLGVDDFKSMVRLGRRINYEIKGADQDFLNQVILPKVANPARPSIVEHYLLGMPQSFRGECYHEIQDIPLPDVKPMFSECNRFIEHIGADGYKQDQCLLFFDKHFTSEQKDYHNEIEDKFKEVFYWRMPI
jgi:hypothetical protein